MMSPDEIQDRLNAMRNQEDSTYACNDYLARPKKSQQQQQGVDTIDHICRFKMTEWCYTVIDYINFHRETVSVAMNCLDRFLASGCPRAEQVISSRREYQLASMTTLFMAIKINEPVVVDIALMTELSKGVYNQSDFKKMETDILFGLNWYVNGPTAQNFALHLLTLMQQKQEHMLSMGFNSPPVNYDDLLQSVTYKIELSVGEYKLMIQKPSVIATASIWSCIEELKMKPPSISCLKQIIYEIAACSAIQMDYLEETKDFVEHAKLRKSMQRRSTCTSLMCTPSSPRSTASSPTNSQCSKNETNHCSPICISKRNLVPNQ